MPIEQSQSQQTSPRGLQKLNDSSLEQIQLKPQLQTQRNSPTVLKVSNELPLASKNMIINNTNNQVSKQREQQGKTLSLPLVMNNQNVKGKEILNSLTSVDPKIVNTKIVSQQQQPSQQQPRSLSQVVGSVKPQEQTVNAPFSYLDKLIMNQKNSLVPPDCEIDYDDQDLSKIGQLVMKTVELKSNGHNRRKLLMQQIKDKIEDLQDERKRPPVKQMHQKEIYKGLQANIQKQIENAIEEDFLNNPQQMKQLYIGDLEPYQYYLNFQDKYGEKNKGGLKKKLTKLPKIGKDGKQVYDSSSPRISMDLKIEEDIQDLANRFGLIPKEKYGDTMTSNQNQENLKKIVEKHYKRTKMRDYELSVKELRMFFSGTNSNLLKEKYNQQSQSLQTSPRDNLNPKIEISVLDSPSVTANNSPINIKSYLKSKATLKTNPSTFRKQSSKSFLNKEDKRIKQNQSQFIVDKNNMTQTSIFGDRKSSVDVFHQKLLAKTKRIPTRGRNNFNQQSDISYDSTDEDKKSMFNKTQNSFNKKNTISDSQSAIEEQTQLIKQKLNDLILKRDLDSITIQDDQQIPNFIASILATDKAGEVHVANKYQFQQIEKIFNKYYNYFEPKNKKRLESFQKSYKKMTLRDFEKLANKGNILKFDIDRKLSQHLNKLLTSHKDDDFFNARYQAYLRKQPHENKQNVFKRLSVKFTEAYLHKLGVTGSKVVEANINSLKNEVEEIIQSSPIRGISEAEFHQKSLILEKKIKFDLSILEKPQQ